MFPATVPPAIGTWKISPATVHTAPVINKKLIIRWICHKAPYFEWIVVITNEHSWRPLPVLNRIDVRAPWMYVVSVDPDLNLLTFCVLHVVLRIVMSKINLCDTYHFSLLTQTKEYHFLLTCSKQVFVDGVHLHLRAYVMNVHLRAYEYYDACINTSININLSISRFWCFQVSTKGICLHN